MTFDKGDLKVLKTWLASDPELVLEPLSVGKLQALVARLEAAEKAIAGEFENSPLVQAWRKSKGDL